MRTALDHHAVAADDDILGRTRQEQRESRNFDVYFVEFVATQRRESWVPESCRFGILSDREPEWRHPFDMSDTAAEATVDFEGDKGTAVLEKRWILRSGRRRRPVFQTCRDRFTGQAEEDDAPLIRDCLWVGRGCHPPQDAIVPV